MAYQIDFLPVGDGANSGDAIAMRFSEFLSSMKTYVVAIDGGFPIGEALVNHVCSKFWTCEGPRYAGGQSRMLVQADLWP